MMSIAPDCNIYICEKQYSRHICSNDESHEGQMINEI